jgi:hypothetical protein
MQMDIAAICKMVSNIELTLGRPALTRLYRFHFNWPFPNSVPYIIGPLRSQGPFSKSTYRSEWYYLAVSEICRGVSGYPSSSVKRIHVERHPPGGKRAF